MTERFCPHCSQPNEPGAAFCAACGKALPTSTDGSPRLVSVGDEAATSAGREMQIKQLFKTARRSSIALIAVGILTMVFAFIIMGMGDDMGLPRSAIRTLVLTNGVLASAYIALGIWARRSPLPASIVGLVVFLSIQVYNSIIEPEALAQGLLIKIIVIIVLVRAIKAGLNHRRLAEKIEAPTPGA